VFLERSAFAFSYELSEVIFPRSCEIACIADRAFYSCIALKHFFLPKTVELGSECFSVCQYLAIFEFEKDSRLSRIGRKAFFRTGLEKIVLPESVEYLDDCCFNECFSLSEVSIAVNSRLNYVGPKCFRGTRLKGFGLSRSVDVLNRSVFQACHFLDTLVFDSKCYVKKIGTFAFYNSSLSKNFDSSICWNSL
jgi:hypothetical protein